MQTLHYGTVGQNHAEPIHNEFPKSYRSHYVPKGVVELTPEYEQRLLLKVYR